MPDKAYEMLKVSKESPGYYKFLHEVEEQEQITDDIEVIRTELVKISEMILSSCEASMPLFCVALTVPLSLATLTWATPPCT